MGGIGLAVAIVSAVLAGGFLAVTGVLQQWAASERPGRESLSPRLLLSLARNRTWLLGLGTGVISYGFQALALAFGPLTLVQPVFASELLFAAPISVRLHRTRMHAREWTGVICVPAGLAIGILLAAPQRGDPLPPLASWGFALGLVALAAGGTVLAGRNAGGPARASAYAFAGATVMALQSALLAATVALMRQGVVPLFTSWQPYSLIPVTALGVLLVESAYQAGPLVASMPVMDAAEPSVAIALGVALFGEHVETSPLHLAGTAAGLALFLAGIVLLDTSPVMHRLQRQQDATVSTAAQRSAPRSTPI